MSLLKSICLAAVCGLLVFVPQSAGGCPIGVTDNLHSTEYWVVLGCLVCRFGGWVPTVMIVPKAFAALFFS